MFRHRAPQPN